MGHRTTISGHIQEPYYIKATDRQTRWLLESNSRAINSLPLDDKWPFLIRPMFSFSPLSPTAPNCASSTYRGRVIYFGGSFSSLHEYWGEWLIKFENLLRQLYWEHAVVVLITEVAGQHQCRWDAKMDSICLEGDTHPHPIKDWTFTGPRRIW
jgi:hypothetical protein